MKVYNRVFTKEKWENVNEFNKTLLDDYMLQIKAEGKSEGSQKQYYNDARIILIYIMEQHKNKELYKLTRKSFRNFVLWCQEANMSSARINRLLVTCRNLMNFGLDEEDFEDDFEDCKVNPSRIKGLQKKKKRDIVFLTDDEIHLIINKLIDKKEYSQALFAAIMYDSAARRKEVFQLKRDDISLDSNISKSAVVGKRGKVYRPIYNDLTKRCYELLENSREDDLEALFLTQTNTPASYETLYNWVISWRKILERETGVIKEFNPHSFRHSAADNLETGTHYIAKKANKKFTIMEIQKLMNHSDLSTTQSYLADRSEEELLATFCI